jgi:hypothetical protein
MLTLGIVHSMIHTLLLALSASGCSADVHEQWAIAVVRQSIATTAQSGTEKKAEKSSEATRKSPQINGISRILFVPALHFTARALPLPSAYDHTLWEIPAKNAVLRIPRGGHFAKIRKTFTVQTLHTPHAAYLLAASAPPDDYDHLPVVI